MKTIHESLDDLKRVVEELTEFAEDVVYSSPFETTLTGGTGLFGTEHDRIVKLASRVEPEIGYYEPRLHGPIDPAFPFLHEEPELKVAFKDLPNDLQDRLGGLVYDTRKAYLTIGVFIGARLADPTGQVLANVGAGWLRAMLTHGCYQHLKSENKPAKRKRSRARVKKSPVVRNKRTVAPAARRSSA